MALTMLPERAPARARRTPSMAVAAAVLGAVAVLGCLGWWLARGSSQDGSTATSVSTSTLAAPHSASQWLQAALSTARAQRSVHLEIVNRLGRHVLRYSDDDGASSGVQRIMIDPGMRAEVRVIGSATYFVADRAALVKHFGFPRQAAARVDSRWMLLSPGVPGYREVTEGVTLRSALRELNLRSPLSLLPARTMHGVRVIGIRGLVSGEARRGEPTARATLWINATGAHLPVAYTAVGKRIGSMNVTFDNWGARLEVAPPATAIPLGGASKTS